MATLGALESMLIDFGGSALIVSHDRWLLDRVATSILSFGSGGRLERHAGNYSEYRDASTATHSRTLIGRPLSPAPDARRRDAPLPETARRLNGAERRELDALPDDIERAEAKVVRLQTELADPEVYRDGGGRASELRAGLEAAEGRGGSPERAMGGARDP